MAKVYKIRYNTDYPAMSKYPWRVIEIISAIEWHEVVAMHVNLHCHSKTSMDTMPDGRIKYHISILPQHVQFGLQSAEESYDLVDFF